MWRYFFLSSCFLNITQTKKKTTTAVKSLEVDCFHSDESLVTFFGFFFSFSQPPLNTEYKWLRNGKNVPTATGSTLKIEKDKLAREELFTCVVHNLASSESAAPVRYTCGQQSGEHHARVPAAWSL